MELAFFLKIKVKTKMHNSLVGNVPIHDSDTDTSVSTTKDIYDEVLDSSAQLSSDM